MLIFLTRVALLENNIFDVILLLGAVMLWQQEAPAVSSFERPVLRDSAPSEPAVLIDGLTCQPLVDVHANDVHVCSTRARRG